MDEEMKKKAAGCACPYCEEEIVAAMLPFCRACGVTIRYCAKCEIPVAKDAKVCPECGGKITSR